MGREREWGWGSRLRKKKEDKDKVWRTKKDRRRLEKKASERTLRSFGIPNPFPLPQFSLLPLLSHSITPQTHLEQVARHVRLRERERRAARADLHSLCGDGGDDDRGAAAGDGAAGRGGDGEGPGRGCRQDTVVLVEVCRREIGMR